MTSFLTSAKQMTEDYSKVLTVHSYTAGARDQNFLFNSTEFSNIIIKVGCLNSA